MNDTYATVKTCRCDSCGRLGLGVEQTLRGTPILFVCRACNGQWFEREAVCLLLKALLPTVFEAA